MITPQMEDFCQAYTTKGDTYGIAYKSYSFAYEIPIPLTESNEINYKSSEYAVCQSSGSRLLLKDEIKARISAILLAKLNDANVDTRLADIIEGGKDTDAIQGIKIFNDLKQRITKKLDITTGGRPLAGLSDEELDNLTKD